MEKGLAPSGLEGSGQESRCSRAGGALPDSETNGTERQGDTDAHGSRPSPDYSTKSLPWGLLCLQRGTEREPAWAQEPERAAEARWTLAFPVQWLFFICGKFLIQNSDRTFPFEMKRKFLEHLFRKKPCRQGVD